MNKQELITKITEAGITETKKGANELLATIDEVIKVAVASQEKTKIGELFTVEVVEVKAKKGESFGKEWVKEAHNTVVIKATPSGKNLA